MAESNNNNTTGKNEPRDEWDDILDSALDDFENVEKKEATKATQKSTKDESFDLASDLSNNNNNQEKPELTPDSYMDEVTKLIEGLSTGTFDKSLEELLADSKNFPNLGGLDMDNLTEESLEKWVEEFENKPEMQEVMEEMMNQLMSKDVMYEPMKKMQEKYPTWLESNKPKLSADELANYNKQFEIVNAICTEFEKEQCDIKKVTNLMQDMQETGQPPLEIVQALSDGEISPEALQNLPNLADDQNCSIM